MNKDFCDLCTKEIDHQGDVVLLEMNKIGKSGRTDKATTKQSVMRPREICVFCKEKLITFIVSTLRTTQTESRQGGD